MNFEIDTRSGIMNVARNDGSMKTTISATKLLLSIALLASTLLACDLGLGNLGQISFGAPTPSSTRTPRPTFTPRIEFTPTSEDTATPPATDTPAKTVTNTRAPVVIARTATKPPAPTPLPSFPVKLVLSYGCGQDGIYEIIGSIRRPGSVFLGNYVLALMTPDGRILKRGISLPDDQQIQGLDISCQRSGILPHNVKIDGTEFRTAGQLIVRVIKSENDPTPLSVNVTVDFSSPGRTFVFYDVP